MGRPAAAMGVLGRRGTGGPTCELGRHRARDGSDGAAALLDVDRPHAALVVGKRGHGKSHTLGVLAEALADADAVVPVVADPTGALRGLSSPPVGARIVDPAVRADALPPPAWPALFGLSPTDPAGSLLWRAAGKTGTLDGMRAAVDGADATRAARRAALNHLDRAAGWGVFDPDGFDAAALPAAPVVLDLAGIGDAPANAALRAIARALYDARVADDGPAPMPLPWLLVDEAHAYFGGVARPALETLLRRGRAPGASLVAATQCPDALPGVAVSQSDLLVAHRLTAAADVEALRAARPTYLGGDLADRLPTAPGEALVVDDATESVRTVRVRDRLTPHRGASPRASREA